MVTLEKLAPSATLSELHPPDTVYAPRSTMSLVRWAYRDAFMHEASTVNTLTVAGDMPVICSRTAATDRVMDYFRQVGFELSDRRVLYDTEDDYLEVARECIRRGKKLIYPLPLPPPLQDPGGLVVPASLYNRLNDKANLELFVNRDGLPPFRVIGTGCLNQVLEFLPRRAVYVKACHPGASGGGVDVFYCHGRTDRERAIEVLSARRSELSAVRVEEALDTSTTWCMNLAVMDGSVRYLGAAIQLFSGPGKQRGSRIDPDFMPPPEAVTMAGDIADKARAMGYRGLAGFDMGVTGSGTVVVFDLNFRIAASTIQVLLHDSATRRVGGRITQSWQRVFRGPLDPVLERLSGFVQSGMVVPRRIFDASPRFGERSLVSGIMVGSNLSEIDALEAELDSVTGDLFAADS